MPAIAAMAGFLGLGALAAGLADPLPESARAVGAIVLVLAIPAYLVSAAIAAPTRAHPTLVALRTSLSLLVWFCLLALWTSAFALAGAPFRTYAIATTWALLAWFALHAGVSLRRRVRTDASPASRGWWIVLAGCVLFAALFPPRLNVGEDGLDHVGYIRHVLTENSLRPAGVLAPPADDAVPPPDPRKGALHPVLALTSWISSADPMVTWRWFSALMFPAAAAAALAFNGAFLASRAARIAAGALVLLTFNGNALRFSASSPHGEATAAMWCWALTALVVTGAARPARWYMWTLLAAGGVLVHLGVAWHVLVLVSTIVLCGGTWGIPTREKLRVSAALLAGVALAFVVRRHDLGGDANPIHAHTQGVMFVVRQWFVASPMEILRLHGMLFLGGLACVPALWFVRSRPHARAILAAAAVPLALSFVPWVATWLYERGSYMVFRSLLQVPVFAAIVVCGSALAAGIGRRSRRALWVGVPAAAVWLVVFLRPVPGALVADARSVSQPQAWNRPTVSPALIRAVGSLPSDAVVLSDPATSYALSAHTSQRFVAVYEQHGNPRDAHALERIQAVRDVLSPFVVPDRAVSACRRFGVDYVVLNGDPPRDVSQFLSVWRAPLYPAAFARLDALGAAFTLVDTTRSASVFRYDPGVAIGRAWASQGLPVTTGVPELASCAVDAPRDRFRIIGVSLQPPVAAPGDTLRVTLGYHRDSLSRFGFPELVHVRFDHEILDRGREFPFEKQWRRFSDGRAGVRSRFREDLRPGHGVYEPDLWPVGWDLKETFLIMVPAAARTGDYRVEVSIATETLVPNFHLRDLFFNRDHYSGTACARLSLEEHR